MIVAVALFVIGLAIRERALPEDGLVFDDAWVVLGAGKVGLGRVLSVTTLQPGFTVLLRPWYHLVSSRTELMAVPVFVVGAMAGSVSYLALRRWRVAWVICLVTSVVVLAAPVAIQYSGRVKPYVIEIVLVILLAAALPRLASHRWGWPAVALWVAAALVLGAFSAYMLPATAAAGVILVLHPSADRAQRFVGVALQAVVTAVYLRQVQSSYDAAGTNRGWERTWNSYIELAGPLRMGREIATHLARLGQIVVGGTALFGFTLVVVAVSGLAWEGWRGRRRIPARFLLALLAVAFVGGLTRQIPFGPAAGGDPDVYPGGRASLWLLPSLAFGVAFGLDAVARQLRRYAPAASAPLSIILLAACAIVVGRNTGDRPPYPSTGAKSAHEFVERESGADDVVIVLENALWTYAAEPGVDVGIYIDNTLLNGFTPILRDRQVWSQERGSSWDGSLAQMSERTANAPRVLIVNGYVGAFDGAVAEMESALRVLGYRPAGRMHAWGYAVSVWESPAPRVPPVAGSARGSR